MTTGIEGKLKTGQILVGFVVLVFTIGVAWAQQSGMNADQSKDISALQLTVTKLSESQNQIKVDIAETKILVQGLKESSEKQDRVLERILRKLD